ALSLAPNWSTGCRGNPVGLVDSTLVCACLISAARVLLRMQYPPLVFKPCESYLFPCADRFCLSACCAASVTLPPPALPQPLGLRDGLWCGGRGAGGGEGPPISVVLDSIEEHDARRVEQILLELEVGRHQRLVAGFGALVERGCMADLFDLEQRVALI